jgi:hypothetical protein
MQPARRRSAPAGATETTASYSFTVAATSAAGLTEDALQFALLKELVGLRLPGSGRLLVIALGGLAGRTAVHLWCVGSASKLVRDGFTAAALQQRQQHKVQTML